MGTLQIVFALLLAWGILLICAEVFVPGAVLGALGALSLMAAIVVSFKAYPDYAILVTVGIVLLLGLIVVLWVKYFPKSRIGRQMTLSGDAGGFKASQAGLQVLAGREGEASSDLRPAGFAVIDGRRIDVVTEGGMVSKGERVRVIKVEGNRVVVRKMTA